MVTEERAWTLFALLAAVLGAVIARWAMKTGWEAVTGTPPPVNPDDEEVTWRQSLMWGLVSGALVGAVRVASRRSAASAWERWFTDKF